MRPGLGVATAGCSRLGIDGGPAFPLTRTLLGPTRPCCPRYTDIDALDGFLVGLTAQLSIRKYRCVRLFQGEIVRNILPGTCATAGEPLESFPRALKRATRRRDARQSNDTQVSGANSRRGQRDANCPRRPQTSGMRTRPVHGGTQNSDCGYRPSGCRGCGHGRLKHRPCIRIRQPPPVAGGGTFKRSPRSDLRLRRLRRDLTNPVLL